MIERENKALVGILSTQILDHQFVQDFPTETVHEPNMNQRTSKSFESNATSSPKALQTS